jgi:general secretion pathway protein A
LLTGDLGVGKTTICRTLAEQLRRRVPVAVVPNPLLSPFDLFRLFLEDLGAISSHDSQAIAADTHLSDLYDEFVQFANGLKRTRDGAVLIIDEAHHLPATLLEPISRLSSLTIGGDQVLQVVFASQPISVHRVAMGMESLDARVVTRARLLPFGRDDCARYISHRLTIAGGADITFTSRAIDVVFGMSGGVPRLINLICERALHEAALRGSRKIEPDTIQAAASALELLRTRPRRFRWFHKRVS